MIMIVNQAVFTEKQKGNQFFTMDSVNGERVRYLPKKAFREPKSDKMDKTGGYSDKGIFGLLL